MVKPFANKSKTRMGFMTPLRIILTTALLIYLSYFVYQKFGVGDWLMDVGLVFAAVFFIIIIAFGIVGLILYIKSRKEKI